MGFAFTLPASDPAVPRYLDALRQGLAAEGWSEGRNLRIDYAWETNTADGAALAARQLIAGRPDAVLAAGPQATRAIAKLAPSLPIVFALVADPVGDGMVDSYARPGGTITGFTDIDTAVIGKWLGLAREINPGLKVIGSLRQTTNASPYALTLAALAAPVGIQPLSYSYDTPDDMVATVAALAALPDAALISGTDPFTLTNRASVLSEVARLRLLTIFTHDLFAPDGAIVYAADSFDVLRGAAEYAGSVLKGAKPADLPVQSPTRYQLSINLKTAKAMGITFPVSILAQADQVIA
jgi:putative ABC transport system substrate-binding protein